MRLRSINGIIFRLGQFQNWKNKNFDRNPLLKNKLMINSKFILTNKFNNDIYHRFPAIKKGYFLGLVLTKFYFYKTRTRVITNKKKKFNEKTLGISIKSKKKKIIRIKFKRKSKLEFKSLISVPITKTLSIFKLPPGSFHLKSVFSQVLVSKYKTRLNKLSKFRKIKSLGTLPNKLNKTFSQNSSRRNFCSEYEIKTELRLDARRDVLKNSKLSQLIPHSYLFLKKVVLLLSKAVPSMQILFKLVEKNFPHPNATTKVEDIFVSFLTGIYHIPRFNFPTDDDLIKEIDIYYLLFNFAAEHPEYLTLLVPEELKMKKENEKEEIEKGVKNIVEYLILLSKSSPNPDIFLFNLKILENFFLIFLFNYKSPTKSYYILNVYFENLFRDYVERKRKKINENTIFKEVLEKVNAIIIVLEIKEALIEGFFPGEDENERERRVFD